MKTQPRMVVDGIATSFATRTLLVRNADTDPSTVLVQTWQKLTTANTHRAGSPARTFVFGRRTRQLFKQK